MCGLPYSWFVDVCLTGIEKKIDEHKKKVKNFELFCSGKAGPRGHTKRANDIPLA